jgi:predicted nucleic acid-binding protein
VKWLAVVAGGERVREADVRGRWCPDCRGARREHPGSPCHGHPGRSGKAIRFEPFPAASKFLPQALFNKRTAEAAFYEAFFSTVSRWATDLDAVAEIALREASTNGVEAMDALHVAAAASIGATELITTEKPSRSIHRARAVRVVTIHPEG